MTRKWLSLALILLVALSLVVACQPEATPAPEAPTAEEGAEAPTAAPEPEVDEEPTAAPAEEPVEEPAQGELAKILVTLDWVPNEYQNWMWAGMDKGFYADEGIEVEFFVPTNVETALTAVSAGRTDLGLSISADTILAVGQRGHAGQGRLHHLPSRRIGGYAHPGGHPYPGRHGGQGLGHRELGHGAGHVPLGL